MKKPTTPNDPNRNSPSQPDPIDIENEASLRNYLLLRKLITAKDILDTHLLSGGVSNKTVWVNIGQHSFVLKQGLRQLRVPGEWFSNPARIQREAQGMIALKKILPAQITSLVFVDPRENILMMEAVPLPHENFKELLLKGNDQNTLIRKMAFMLATIHTSTWYNKEVEKEFGNTEYFHELRIDPYFRFCVQKFPEIEPWYQKNIFDKLVIRNCLVHGDFSPKNMLVYQNELILLDHEVIHYGDFAFDFGFIFTHLFLKSVHLHSGAFLKNSLAFSDNYFQEMGNRISADDKERAVHYFLACLFARVAGKSKTNYAGTYFEEKIKNILLEIFLAHAETPDIKMITALYAKILK